MKIVIINGSAGVGKDTFVEMVYNLRGEEGVKSISTVDIPKQIARDYFFWNPTKKTDKDRELLSNLKDLMTWYDDLILKDIISYINLNRSSGLIDILFVHCREPEEIDKLVKAITDINLNVYTLLIQAEDRIKHVPNNHADQNVEDYAYNYYVDNNGSLDDLREAAEIFTGDLS